MPLLIEEDVPARMVLLEDPQQTIGGFKSDAREALRAKEGGRRGDREQRVKRGASGFGDARHSLEDCS